MRHLPETGGGSESGGGGSDFAARQLPVSEGSERDMRRP